MKMKCKFHEMKPNPDKDNINNECTSRKNMLITEYEKTKLDDETRKFIIKAYKDKMPQKEAAVKLGVSLRQFQNLYYSIKEFNDKRWPIKNNNKQLSYISNIATKFFSVGANKSGRNKSILIKTNIPEKNITEQTKKSLRKAFNLPANFTI